VTAVSTWYHHKAQNRGRKKPRAYEVVVQYEQDQRDFERAAYRLGRLEMSGFFVFAARMLIWLLEEAAFRDETAEVRREQERRDREEQEHQDRRVQARQRRESARLSERERDLARQEQELAAREREGKPLQPGAAP
jgi:hypothetical protein